VEAIVTTPADMGGQPDSSVNPDAGFELAQGFSVLVKKLDSLERAITRQAQIFERTTEATMRYGMTGTPRFNDPMLHRVGQAGGLAGAWNPAAQQQVMPLGALSSLEMGQAFLAQRLGTFLAGQPLYGAPAPAGASVSSSPHGGTSTPAGTPVSSPVPGSGAPPAPAPASPQLTGLPGYLWGGQNAAAAPSTKLAMLQQIGARVALSGGTFGGLQSGLRHLPVLGTAIDLFQAGADAYQNQREKGRVFQEVEGGSNLMAQTERWHELVYQASLSGAMPEGAAAQAFGQVTALGYNRAATGEGYQGQNRQSALDFVYHQYNATGMDVNDSVAILKTASQDVTVNLGAVSNALQQLSDTAGKAGTNAETARNQFNSYFNTALGQGASYGSSTLAGAVASQQASMGKEFAGVNFGGQLGQAQQYLMAGMNGITPAEAQQMQRTSPAQYAGLMSQTDMYVIQSLLTPQELADLQQMIRQAGGVNPNNENHIANEFLNKYQVPDQINLDVWAQVISAQVGIQLNPGNVMAWIVNQVGGNTVGAHAQRLSRLNKTSNGGIPGAPLRQPPTHPLGAGGTWIGTGASENLAKTALGNSAARHASNAQGAVNNGTSASRNASARTASSVSGGATANHTVVSLTAEAKQLLKLLPGAYDQAAARANVPVNPWPGQASR
jgi:hypothetical protein